MRNKPITYRGSDTRRNNNLAEVTEHAFRLAYHSSVFIAYLSVGVRDPILAKWKELKGNYKGKPKQNEWKILLKRDDCKAKLLVGGQVGLKESARKLQDRHVLRKSQKKEKYILHLGFRK